MHINDLTRNKTKITIRQHKVLDYFPYYQGPETYFVPVLFVLIFVFGFLGNGGLLIIFVKRKSMRNVTNTFIFSLGLADLLVTIISVPLTFIIYTIESWSGGLLVCKISETVKDISTGVSVFTLIALSADRYLAIVYPYERFAISNGSKNAIRIAVAIAGGIWVLAILCAMPALIGSHIVDIENENGTFIVEVCYPFPEHWLNGTYPRMMVMFKFLVLYIIPLIIIFMLCLGMAASHMTRTRILSRRLQRMPAMMKATKKIAVSVIVLVAVFAICHAPSHVFMLFFYFKENAQDLYSPFWNYLRIVGFCLSYINSCANSVALYFVSIVYRKHFNRYLFCKKQKSDILTTFSSQHVTPISLEFSKRHQSINTDSTISLNRRKSNNTQETSLTLLSEHHGAPQMFNQIIRERPIRNLEAVYETVM